MAEEAAGRRIPFAFLEDIVERFEAMYGPNPTNIVPYGMNEFSRVLGQRTVYNTLMQRIILKMIPMQIK